MAKEAVVKQNKGCLWREDMRETRETCSWVGRVTDPVLRNIRLGWTSSLLSAQL